MCARLQLRLTDNRKPTHAGHWWTHWLAMAFHGKQPLFSLSKISPMLTIIPQLEGLFTVMIGMVFIAVFPGSPAHPISICRITWFSEREVFILRQRILLDDASRAEDTCRISGKDILRTVGLIISWKGTSSSTLKSLTHHTAGKWKAMATRLDSLRLVRPCRGVCRIWTNP
jgi:hypothetical protein